jgi:hypothetical protein
MSFKEAATIIQQPDSGEAKAAKAKANKSNGKGKGDAGGVGVSGEGDGVDLPLQLRRHGFDVYWNGRLIPEAHFEKYV